MFLASPPKKAPKQYGTVLARCEEETLSEMQLSFAT